MAQAPVVIGIARPAVGDSAAMASGDAMPGIIGEN